MSDVEDIIGRAQLAAAVDVPRLAKDLGLPEDSDTLDGLAAAWKVGMMWAVADFTTMLAERRAKRQPEDASPID